jgi:ribosomal protein S18 acetylase RimI-like enzyme
MESKISFKKGTTKDINRFLKFFKTSIGKLFFDHYSPNSINYTVEVDYGPKWMRGQLKKNKKQVYLSYDKDKITGYLFVSRSIAGVAFADWLAVDKPYQKKGIASNLLALWEKREIKAGAHSLFLWTTKNNLIFYQGRGFKVGGDFPNAWHGVHTFLIYKNLMEPKEENFLKSYLKKKTKK